MASNPIFTGTTVTLQPNSPHLFPDPAGKQVSLPPNTSRVEVSVGLSLADKLAVGNRLDIAAYFSIDDGSSWSFVNGITWNSYGPDGLTVTNIDGTQLVNPDPKISVPLNGRTGNVQVRISATGSSALNVTPVFNAF